MNRPGPTPPSSYSSEITSCYSPLLPQAPLNRIWTAALPSCRNCVDATARRTQLPLLGTTPLSPRLDTVQLSPGREGQATAASSPGR